jgi:hypothetical protein
MNATADIKAYRAAYYRKNKQAKQRLYRANRKSVVEQQKAAYTVLTEIRELLRGAGVLHECICCS